jgi:hypothetical protein
MFLSNVKDFEFFTLNEKLNNILSTTKKIIKVPINECLKCRTILINFKQKEINVYFQSSSEKCLIQTKICKICNIQYNLNTYKFLINNEAFYYPKLIDMKFIQTSTQIVFEKNLIEIFDQFMSRNQVTFEGFTETYNKLYINNKLNRELNRKRLTECWFYYKILNYHYQFSISPVSVFNSKETESYLDSFFQIIKNKTINQWFISHNEVCKAKNCANIGGLI